MANAASSALANEPSIAQAMLLPARAQARSSRDEMNLAEFPLTVLSTRADTKIKTLEFSDSVRGKNGEIVERRWIITAADKFGLPTASDDEVLLGLLKLTVDSGFRDRKVFFTRYELPRILRWSTEGRSYSRLQNALDRLSGVRIKATNAFYDNEAKTHNTKNFGILDGYEINDGRSMEPKPSFFQWSDVLFKSFQVGFIKKLDLDFFLELRSAVSKRLYRYLDKHFWYRSKVQINVFTLAHEKIGVSRNYQHLSSIRQQLDPAFEELRHHGFIDTVEYIGKGRDAEVAIFAGRAKPRMLDKESSEKTSADLGGELCAQVRELLVSRGIRESQIPRLLEGRPTSQLERIKRIVEHFDELLSSGSPRVSKSPVGFLYRAVEDPEHFSLPGENSRKGIQEALQLKVSNVGSHRQPPVQRKPKRARESLESEYLIDRKLELQRIRATVESSLLTNIEREVEAALHKLRGLISEARFAEAVAHAVDEKLARLFALPSFDEWVGRREAS